MKLPPYGEINKFYRGTVSLPEGVCEAYGDSTAFDAVFRAAGACVEEIEMDWSEGGYVIGYALNHRQVEDFCQIWNRAIQAWQAEMRRKEAGYE